MMLRRLLVIALPLVAVVAGGCSSGDSAPPPEAAKTLTDAQFEESIKNAPPAAQARAREEREKAKGMENIGKRDK